MPATIDYDLGLSEKQEQEVIDTMIISVGVPRILKLGLEQQAKMKELLNDD